MVPLQILCAILALGGAILLEAPVWFTGPLAVACISGVVTGGRARPSRAALACACLGSAAAWSTLPLPTPDPAFALIALACAATLGCAAFRLRARLSGWTLLTLGWFAAASGLLLAAGYAANQAFLFYVGWALIFLTLAALPLFFRLPLGVVQVLLGILLFLMALPFIDWALRPGYRGVPRLEDQPYSFAAGRDPRAFERWWNYYRDQWDVMGSQVFKPDPAGLYPFRLRESSQGRLAESLIHINHLGFRGPEFEVEKGRVIRILAIGESTTFGCTLRSDDRPWPEVLQERINSQLKPARPVEVINAGVPAYTLVHNVRRLEEEFLRLQPDIVLSYHGYNGFRMLDDALPPVQAQRPPAYRERPLKLFADLEYRVRLYTWKRRVPHAPAKSARRTSPFETAYADAYRRLIQLCQTNGVDLALANFSMAVNPGSAPEVVEFYRRGFPSVHAQIQANGVHSGLVRALAAQNPGVLLIDTQPGLDGCHEKFIDLIHLTQEGRNSLAEAFFKGLRPWIQNRD